MDIRITPTEPDCFYHIYNRGINGEVIFKSDRNYLFFLNKINNLLPDVCDIYAYCLMPNHFHLLVRIKSDTELEKFAQLQPHKTVDEKGLHAPQHIFSKQFSKIFNSYSQAFNKENSRHGALIESPFKRKKISTEKYLRKCIIYIHQNPVLTDFRNYSFSSYKAIINDSDSMINRGAVIGMFDDVENFELCHQKQTDYEF